MRTDLTSLLRRVEALERKLQYSGRLDAQVVDNEDPDGMQRIKVKCSAIPAWEVNGSPWIPSDETMGGDQYGAVNTPAVGSWVVIYTQNGNTNTFRWSGSSRSEVNRPPSEFSDPEINGIKTVKGTMVVFNDKDGEESLYVEVPSGSKVYLNEQTQVITVGETKLNEGDIPIALGGPIIKCPVTGADIPASTTCFVKGP